MNLSITNQIDNPLLERTELTFNVTHPGEKPPRKDVVRESIANQLNAKKSLVIIHRMKSIFGSQELEGEAKVYKKAERLMEIERKHIQKRNNIQAKKEEKKEASE
jgi:small subunit ribosomal protein S24e